MKRQQTFTDIEHANRKRRTKMDEFLEAMDAIIEWTEWCAVVEPYYPLGKRGRPPRGVEIMLRMYLLQNWYNLADEAVEEAIYNTYPMARFMGIDFLGSEQVPDATTLCKFRQLLDENDVTKKIFGTIKGFLEKHGKIMHGGTIVDATIVAAPSSTKNEKHERDPEMHQVKKGNQWYFGERLHIGTDAGSGYIHDVEVTAANVGERDVVSDLVREDDEVVYGDAGYCGMENREEAKNDPHLSQIDWRTNNKKPRNPSEAWKQGEAHRWHKIFNAQKSRVRCKVEYPFLIIKRIFHYNKVRYRGIKKNRTQAYTLCALANLYMLRQSGFVGTT
jgi:IS5 family transposase